MIELPDIQFFLYGMGDRQKYLYKGGALVDPFTGHVHYTWDVAHEKIIADEYRVEITLKQGSIVRIEETESGIYLHENESTTALVESDIKLPDFKGNKHRSYLRILHQEILINIVDGKPLPNFFVYGKPWYRDAAMMAMVLEKTGNLHCIKDWVLSLTEPYDCNNKCEEPDNLGQLLYLISLFSDMSYPLVDRILSEIPKWKKDNHICGITDGNPHPVYQTKWLKFGLQKLGLDDPYIIPSVPDSYSALFWWDYTDAHEESDRFSEKSSDLYPYLKWAEDHFYGLPFDFERCAKSYPLTWEAKASCAEYDGMQIVDPSFSTDKICVPHTWHAAEIFLYLIESSD